MNANVGHAPGTAYSVIRDRVTDQDLLRERAYVDGRWIAAPSGATFEVRDPATSFLIALVASLPAAAAQDAVAVASRALPAWKALLPQQRAAILRRWFDLIIAAREDLALIMTLEQGKPLAEARGEIGYAASFVEWYAEEGKRLNAESVTSHLPGAEMLVRREPLGVAALLTPWNFPSAMLTRKAAAALAAGCTVVAHPSAHAPLSALALALAVLAERAGIPAGVFNIVTGDAATITGVFCADPRVRVVSFTGSTEIGRRIAAQCAPTVKRLIMELGGHAPLIVFDDADVERAAEMRQAIAHRTTAPPTFAAGDDRDAAR